MWEEQLHLISIPVVYYQGIFNQLTETGDRNLEDMYQISTPLHDGYAYGIVRCKSCSAGMKIRGHLVLPPLDDITSIVKTRREARPQLARLDELSQKCRLHTQSKKYCSL